MVNEMSLNEKTAYIKLLPARTRALFNRQQLDGEFSRLGELYRLWTAQRWVDSLARGCGADLPFDDPPEEPRPALTEDVKAARKESAKHAKARNAKYAQREAAQAAGIGHNGPDDESSRYTELGNAHRLVRLFGEDIRYVHARKSWFIWDGAYWRRDDNGEIMRRAEATTEAMFDLAKSIADEAARTAYRKFVLKSQSKGQLEAMISLAQNLIPVVLSEDDLDADNMLLGVSNGTIELKTVTFREGRREDYISKRADVAYDPNAMCPRWIEFQKKIAADDKELIAYKQRVFGLLLTGLIVEKLFIAYGGGANGKTTELETISDILGDYAEAMDASLLIATKEAGSATPEIVALKGKRAVFINETDEKDYLNESRVKYLAAPDMLCGRNLYENRIKFKPTHKPILRTNHKPKIRGTDLGIWRRINSIPYVVTISDAEDIKDFGPTVLMPEASGILNWMLEGLRAFLKDGLKPPKCVLDATEAYRAEQDVAGQWVDLVCFKSTVEGSAKLSGLHAVFSKWIEEEMGWKRAPGRKMLAEVLRTRGYESCLIKGVTHFKA